MPISDKELIINAQNGDIMSLEELIYRYDNMVLRIALKYTGDPDDAKDVYQEVFIRVYKNLANFQFKSEFSTWLFRITTNVCISFKRKYQKANKVSLDVDSELSGIEEIEGDKELAPDSIYASTEFGDKLKAALNKLSPNQKMSFLLKHYEGYKIKEIAEIMSCKEGTIKKYLFEAVRKLQVQLAGTY